MTDILMPKLSDSMEEGTILSWLKADGDELAVGDELVEIETDKATVTYQAEATGVLSLVAVEGDSVAVGAVIARVGVAAESDAEPAPAAAAEEGRSRGPAATPPQEREAAVSNGGGSSGSSSDVRASPLARRVAAQHAVALDTLSGSGPRGRIVRSDVEAAAGILRTPAPPARTTASAPAAVAPVPAAPAPAVEPPSIAGKGAVTRLEPTRQQQLVARRMAETKATVPDFQVATEVDMGAALALRAELKGLAGEDPAPSFNDLVIKATAVALRDHPRANGVYKDGGFELYERINVGMAVAAEDALVVATIFDADGKALGQIARDTRRLATLVREGRITPPELSGGTFTVSNLGMFGMTAISPIINAGQAGILGVGSMRKVLARMDGEVVDRTLMTLTLISDHRILYGADASRFLGRIRDLLETPLLLAL